jgi:hypothetical protein
MIQQVEGDRLGCQVEVDEEDEYESSVGLAIEALWMSRKCAFRWWQTEMARRFESTLNNMRHQQTHVIFHASRVSASPNKTPTKMYFIGENVRLEYV